MEALTVAEAKRRFSELIERVHGGERFLVQRRGVPAVGLVSPDVVTDSPDRGAPVGLAALAGALAEWDDIDEATADIYAARQRADDRAVADLG